MPVGNPGFFTVNANGTIAYNFAGHVHATGLDLDASTTATDPADRKIQWLRQSDGALIADIAGRDLGGLDVLQLRGKAVAPSTKGAVVMRGEEPGGVGAQSNLVIEKATGVAGRITVQADTAAGAAGNIKTIVNGADSSDWLQLLTTANVKLQFGSVTKSVPVNAATQFPTVTLTTAWPSNHFIFFCQFLVATTWVGVIAEGCGPNGLGGGILALLNSNSTQNYTFYWVSLGN